MTVQTVITVTPTMEVVIMDEQNLPTKPRRRRNDLANYGQEFVQPGDNTKYLSHIMAVENLPIIDNSDPVQVQNRITEFFALCAENDVKPTVTGFRRALRISKQTLWDWRHGHRRAGSHQDIICQAYDMLEDLWESYMMNGKINPVSGIFLGKNQFEYADKQEYVVTPNTQPEPVSVKDLEAKYAELPSVED